MDTNKIFTCGSPVKGLLRGTAGKKEVKDDYSKTNCLDIHIQLIYTRCLLGKAPMKEMLLCASRSKAATVIYPSTQIKKKKPYQSDRELRNDRHNNRELKLKQRWLF